MKKYLLLVLCSLTLGLSSCTKDVIAPDTGLPNQTILKYVQPNQWIEDSDRQTLSVDIPVGEIDKDTFDNDDISLMISRGNNETYEKIPFVYNGQSYSYEIRPGFVTLYIQTSDNQVVIPVRPQTVTRIKIVLITSSL